MRISRRTLLAASIALAAAPASAKTRRAFARTQAFLQAYVDATKLPGAMVGIQPRRGPPIHLAAGRISFEPDAPAIGPLSIGRVFSMTKPVTALTAMSLIDSGLLRLDQPIAEILPAFANPRVLVDAKTMETRPASGPITVRHLMTHTAGLGYAIDRSSPLAPLYFKQGLNPGARTPTQGEGAWPANLQAFADRLAAAPLQSDPGARWAYSVSLDLLAAVIEKAAGAPFEAVVRTRITDPLGMKDTGFVVPAADVPRFISAVGVSSSGVTTVDPAATSSFLRPTPYPSGGGGLVSTVADFNRLGAMLLNDGALEGRRVLSRKSMALVRSNLAPAGATAEARGHGFSAGMRYVTSQSATAGEELPGSIGWGGAAGTTFWVDQASGVAVTFMAQFFPSDAYPTASEVRRAFYADWRI